MTVLGTKSQGWTTPDLRDLDSQGNETILSVLDLIDAVKNGREPELIGWKALQATELIFANLRVKSAALENHFTAGC